MAGAARLADMARSAAIASITRATTPTCRRCRRRAAGWPSTSCWRISWRSPWSGSTSGSCPAARSAATAVCVQRVTAALPFALTGAQASSLKEIYADMAARQAHAPPAPGRCRQRQDGRRAAGDAQRGRNRRAGGPDGADRDPGPPALRDAARRWRRRPASRLGILTGRDKGKARAAILREASRRARSTIVVGTHALFQEDVAFRDLALAVIDEQHRFGVHQRLQLSAPRAAASMCW